MFSGQLTTPDRFSYHTGPAGDFRLDLSSGVDVNPEVSERSRKNFEMTLFDSRFFLRKILNDLFWSVTNKLNTKRSG